MTGPSCDYKDCSRHAEQIERDSLTRHHYCAPECRDDERKRRRNERRAAAQKGV